MLAKILMCSCCVEKFHSEGNEYMKKLTHFHCKCKEKHLLYVLLYNKHPYGSGFIPQMEKKMYLCHPLLLHWTFVIFVCR